MTKSKKQRYLDLALLICTGLLFLSVFVLLYFISYIFHKREVLYVQDRIGKNGAIFKIYKFRTMTIGNSVSGQVLPDNSEITRFGAFMRRFKLDEIPQFFNIFCGDMSFVGPRPLLPDSSDYNIPIRLQLRPGLTGLAQINGNIYLSRQDKLNWDIKLVKSFSVNVYLMVLLRTFKVILLGENHV